MSNDPPQRGFGGWNLQRSFSEWGTESFFKETLHLLNHCFCSFWFCFHLFFIVEGTSLIEMIRNACELDQLVRFRRPSTDLEVKYKCLAYCWRRRCFGKLQDDPFLLKFKKHFSGWRWLTINANFYILIKSPLYEQNGVSIIRF